MAEEMTPEQQALEDKRVVLAEREAQQRAADESPAPPLPRRPLAAALAVWLALAPVWLGVLLFFAAAGGGLGDPTTGEASWETLAIALVFSSAPWLILGLKIVQWWHQGREGLRRTSLAWLLLLMPYFWFALLVPSVRLWWLRV